MVEDIECLSYDEYEVLGKSNGEFYHLKCYLIRDAYHMLPATHGLIEV